MSTSRYLLRSRKVVKKRQNCVHVVIECPQRSAWSAQVIIRAFHDFRDSSIYDIIQSDIKVTQKRRKLCLQKERWYSIEQKSMPINPRHCCNSFVNTEVDTVMEFLALGNMICWKVTQKCWKLCLQKQRWYSIERKSMPMNPRHCCNFFVNTKVDTVMEFLAIKKCDLLKFLKIYMTYVMFVYLQRW